MFGLDQRLPVELERYIFEILALSCFTSIPKLMLVAARVKEWLEPLLYRTVINSLPIEGLPACTLNILRLVQTRKPAAFLRDAVRNLMLMSPHPDDVLAIVSLLTGVENVNLDIPIMSQSPALADFLFNLPLRHLYLSIEDFIDMTESDSLRYPCLANITHLELFAGGLRVRLGSCGHAQYARLATLPCLTHLAFNFVEVVPFCAPLLSMCTRLRALVLAMESGEDLNDEMAIPGADPRFVVMRIESWREDWQKGIVTGADYWTRADDFIAQRMSGEIPRTVFFLDDSDE